jgi:hypothetical protein
MAGCGYVDLAAARVDAWEHALVMRFTETRGLVGWRQHEAQWQVPALARRPPTADELCGWRGVFADDDFDGNAPQAGPKRTAAGIDVTGTRFFDWDYAPPRITKCYRTEAPAVPSSGDRASGLDRPQRIASTTVSWFDSLVPTPEAPPLTASQQLAAIEARRRRGRPLSVRSGDDYDSQGRGSIELAPPTFSGRPVSNAIADLSDIVAPPARPFVRQRKQPRPRSVTADAESASAFSFSATLAGVASVRPPHKGAESFVPVQRIYDLMARRMSDTTAATTSDDTLRRFAEDVVREIRAECEFVLEGHIIALTRAFAESPDVVDGIVKRWDLATVVLAAMKPAASSREDRGKQD